MPGAGEEIVRAAFVQRVIVGAGIAGRRVDMEEARDERFEDALALPPTGGGERAHRRAVIAAVAGEDLEFVRMAGLLVILPGHLHRRFGRLRATGEQFDRAEAVASEIEQIARQFERGRVRPGEWGREGECVQLLRHRPDHRAVAVARRS